MFVNGKMRPVETTLGVGGGGIKENDGQGEFIMLHCKNFCKCYNLPPVQQ
jgi:hypothetical protein